VKCEFLPSFAPLSFCSLAPTPSLLLARLRTSCAFETNGSYWNISERGGAEVVEAEIPAEVVHQEEHVIVLL
jgi:hypothetical protein